MAKKLSKKQRQIQKQKRQNKLIRQGYDRKQVETLSNVNLQKLATANISQVKSKDVNKSLEIIEQIERERQRQERERQRQELRKEANRKSAQKYRKKLQDQRREKEHLISDIIGVDRHEWRSLMNLKTLDRYSLEGLQKGKYKRTDFRQYIPKEYLKPVETFNFEKVYQILNGKKLHFAFRSLNGERDISEELEYFSKMTNEELLSFLKSIKEMPQTRSKSEKGSRGRSKGSSGQAGESLIRLNSQEALSEVYADERNADRRATTFNKLLSKSAQKKGVSYQHSSIDYHWQSIRQKDENGRLKAYTEITPRKLLIIGNALLWNVTESQRGGLYNEFYSVCVDIIPDMKNILP